jgi:hypothetical protein
MMTEDAPLLQRISSDKSPMKWLILIGVVIVIIAIVLFLTAPRQPVVNYDYEHLTFHLRPNVYLNFTERYTIQNPNFATMHVKWLEVAGYYGSYTLGVWTYPNLPTSIGLRGYANLLMVMGASNLPSGVANSIQNDCAQQGYITVRFDGFIAVSYLFYEQLWRPQYNLTIECPS